MDAPVVFESNELRRLQRIRNGEKAAPTFSATEMQRRQEELRRILADRDLDAAILTSYHNVNYTNLRKP